jgi:hypothetical protein
MTGRVSEEEYSGARTESEVWQVDAGMHRKGFEREYNDARTEPERRVKILKAS